MAILSDQIRHSLINPLTKSPGAPLVDERRYPRVSRRSLGT